MTEAGRLREKRYFNVTSVGNLVRMASAVAGVRFIKQNAKSSCTALPMRRALLRSWANGLIRVLHRRSRSVV
jgi:hypothetical protein